MVRDCRPREREPTRSWLARRSTIATSTPASASSPASIIPVGPPPAITTACSVMATLLLIVASDDWPASGAREDHQLLGRPGHRDVAVDRSFDARAERLRVDEDDQVELEPLRQLRGQRPDTGCRPDSARLDWRIADDAGDPVGMRGEPGVEDRAQIRSRSVYDGEAA